jgi:predicted RNase H-like nuclease (RuvC/YqgF family)
MRKLWLLLLGAGLAVGVAGCVSVKAPKEINVGGGAEPVDSGHVPHTDSHSEARHELKKAYAYIRDLEREREELRAKAQRYKRERDECEDRLERYEDD